MELLEIGSVGAARIWREATFPAQVQQEFRDSVADRVFQSKLPFKRRALLGFWWMFEVEERLS